jgi:hypothetical protein
MNQEHEKEQPCSGGGKRCNAGGIPSGNIRQPFFFPEKTA